MDIFPAHYSENVTSAQPLFGTLQQPGSNFLIHIQKHGNSIVDPWCRLLDLHAKHLLFERALFLQQSGFSLFDIVDLEYYKNALWQVDLIFLNQSVLETSPQLCRQPTGGTGDGGEVFESSSYYALSFDRPGLAKILRLKKIWRKIVKGEAA